MLRRPRNEWCSSSLGHHWLGSDNHWAESWEKRPTGAVFAGVSSGHLHKSHALEGPRTLFNALQSPTWKSQEKSSERGFAFSLSLFEFIYFAVLGSCILQGLRCISQGLHCISQGLRCISQGLHCISQGLHCILQGLHCISQGLCCILLWCLCSVVVACGLSCPTRCGTLVTWPGTEPTSLALECRFLMTGPAGESLYFHCAMDPRVEQLVPGLI